MSYKELNDEQFLALIDIQRKNEDGKMYALMEDTPVADESDGSTDDDIFEPTYTDEGEEIIG
jgi:hypothetical protein